MTEQEEYQQYLDGFNTPQLSEEEEYQQYLDGFKSEPLELPPQQQQYPDPKLPPEEAQQYLSDKWSNAPNLADPELVNKTNTFGSVMSDLATTGGKMAETAIDSASQGATFGLADEIAGVLGTPVRMAMNQNWDIQDNYKEARDAARGRTKQLRERDPVTAFAGEMAGGIGAGNALLKGAMSVPKVANALSKAPILSGAGLGVLEGGAYGFGASEGDELLKDTLKGAALSGVAGGAGAGLSKIFRPGNMSDDYARVAEAEDLGYPLSWSETINKKPIEMGENILSRTWVNPTLKNVQKRGGILNDEIIKESGVKGVDNIDELYTYLTTVNRMNKTGKSKVAGDHLVDTVGKFGPESEDYLNNPIIKKRQPTINRNIENAMLSEGVYNADTGVNARKLIGALGYENPTKYGPGSSNKVTRLGKTAGQFRDRTRPDKQDETNSLLTFLGFTGIGAGIGGPAGALAALLTPDVGSVLMKGGNKLAQTKGLDRKMAQAAINMTNQMNSGDRMDSVDSLMGILGLLGTGAQYAGPAYGAYKLGSGMGLYK